MAKAKQQDALVITDVKRESIMIPVLGTSPLILHRMGAKAKQELLFPRRDIGKKRQTLKHDPLEEFQDAPERMPEADAPTLLAVPATAFKSALRGAAVDQAGVAKAQIGRLTVVPGEYVPIYGIPQLHMSVVRQGSGLNKTPDIRTRCIVRHWAAHVPVEYVAPLLNQQIIIGLMQAAGSTQGIGDWRIEKGAGSYGAWTVPDERAMADFRRIVETGGRAAQEAAMKEPTAYDTQTADLWEWFETEVARRGVGNLRVVA